MTTPAEKIEIFTDGACKGNPGPGGYGCLIRQNGQTRELKGAEPNTTNNIMELTAAIVALEDLKEPSEVDLTTDSQYLVKGITEWLPGWIRKNWVNASRQPVKNKELWQKLDRLNKLHQISWHWVRGHSGHPENERADQLANEAIAEAIT
ncbi:MAG: ribonuclease HI [Candidatus Nitronauta litoralis]|uniref:Ribonuclease H n=1 Tax=Candidatus Nitronauta litoralis TaxID=2705533 RepID=A0A7T0BVN9_9BACT|nr:MAG: ribonuclease HI [Candidatus Nitronauta litoralis]